MSKWNISYRRARGLSLVELLVAITLSAILMGGAITLFVNNRDTYRTTNDLSRLQETGRFAFDMMIQDIRMAGHFGCADRIDTVENDTLAAANSLVDPTNPIEGLDSAGNWQPSSAAAPAGIVAGTDGITLRYLSGSMADLPAPGNGTPDHQVVAWDNTDPTAIQITLDAAANDFSANQVVGISNCGGANIFQVSAAAPTATILVAGDPLSRIYEPSVNNKPMLAPYVGVRYFIANSPSGSGPSLFRSSIDPVTLGEIPVELFEGVESLQLLYGEDTTAPIPDGTPDTYVNATGVGNWQNVVSVRIGILVRSVDERGQDTNSLSYQVNDVNLGPFNDRRHRRVFTTTAMLRNI